MEKDFYSIDEVEQIVGKNRGTVYNRIKLLKIEKHKFPQDSKTYISAKDVEKIKIVVKEPWRATELITQKDLEESIA
jgi:hypothetical protein